MALVHVGPVVIPHTWTWLYLIFFVPVHHITCKTQSPFMWISCLTKMHITFLYVQ